MNAVAFLLRYAEGSLFKLNILLSQNGLPFYYLGNGSFDTNYRMAPQPRFVGQWFPPFLRIDEIYLSYLPESPDQKDIVYSASKNTIEITEIK